MVRRKIKFRSNLKPPKSMVVKVGSLILNKDKMKKTSSRISELIKDIYALKNQNIHHIP